MYRKKIYERYLTSEGFSDFDAIEKQFNSPFYVDENTIHSLSKNKNAKILEHHRLLLSTLKETTIQLIQNLEDSDLGIIQEKSSSSYYGKKEIKSILYIKNVDDYSVEELNKLIKCFGYFLYKNKKITKINKHKKIIRVNYLPNYLGIK
jgi:hypothetical protein